MPILTAIAAAVVDGARKTVLITGISRGLGHALALELARRGHTVLGCSRSVDKTQSVLSELVAASPATTASDSPPNHLVADFDVRLDGAMRDFAKLCLDSNRVPDIIVNNAGTINKNNKLWEVPVEEFNDVMDTNIKGVANVLRHFIPLMIQRKQGIVINISSSWGRSAAAQVAPYCASKWAIEGLTRSIAKELPPGIAIIALNPGVVNTEMLASCFGSSASLYQTPETWAPKAANMILNLTVEDNGASLTV